MLSDEEKKAIQYLNKYCDTDLIYEQRHYNYIKMIIRLVGKQSKEIEELKQNIHLKEVYVLKTNDYIKGTNIEDELCNKKWEDKIKVKIEELEKMNIHEFETMNVLEVLQSLLAKE